MLIRKVFLLVILILSLILVLAGLFMMLNGSLEMIPTPEQAEKAVIAGGIQLSAGSFAGIVSAVFLYISEKKKKSGT